MILILLIVSALCFFLFNTLLVKNRMLHLTTSVISFIVVVLSTVLITMNFHDHYGMHKVTTTENSELVSSNDKMGMLLYQPIGTSGKDKVVIYKTNDDQKKPSTTSIDKNTNHIITNAKEAKLVTKTTRYEYNSKSSKFWFDLAQKPTRVKTVNYFYVPKDWLTLTTNQAKALPNIINKLQAPMQTDAAKAQMKSAAENYVKNQMTTAMKNDPKMSKDTQVKLAKKAAKDFQNQMKAQSMGKIMPQLKQELSKIK
ncbi:DUF4811 domain-containing protein [Apilactobacillus micheneri]|uniref:DUF4811 domain-containing protein n=1 Tax=Apilactobacillus micheneri TaxID=1899430 RepID=UPI000D52139C|nr:DUF4811 domain-containing protein [Apilactobacillus micheneri]GAY80452.1 hypothetical protein NBRC113063_01331 [Apilactobacillus micheneri]